MAQPKNRYWVEFAYKGTSFDPFTYFDSKAIERRINNNVPLCDSSDFPVNEVFLEHLTSSNAEVIYASRWLNAAYIIADDVTIDQIREFNFVKSAKKVESQLVISSLYTEALDDQNLQELAERQITLMKGQLFAEKGITGKGVRIAIFDGGFPNVDRHPAFEHIRSQNRILATFDFTKNKQHAYRGNSHGLSTFSNIGGKFGKLFLGLAPDAEYLLAITEVNREIFKEEVWWVAAAEWADQMGAQIINSSLGYTEPRYTPQQMNGRHTMVSKVANMAVAKGILVINSAGNEGDDFNWQIIGSPADADSVLSVGGVNPYTGLKIDFSSFGPTAERKLKPNVAASGTTVAAKGADGYRRVNGTSFSAPLITGFAACVMQLYPGLKAMEYFDKIQQSAHLYPYFDYAHGYGVPQADFFYTEKKESKTFSAAFVPTSILKSVHSFEKKNNQEEEKSITREIKIALPKEHSTTSSFKAFDYFYYHIANAKNELVDYEVLIPVKEFTIPISHPDAVIFRAFYQGYFIELILKNE
ncbi:serine protease [Thermaurantimonas aggregans]|uniref:Serine protease n=2 Tax=Thermaurantimonas aggregans TaxID=2173829 RepID=A0A401XJB8_9FLAO|nr:serine protease [Thermaurantimonas aggregans]